jgi:hypothetical protein
MLNVDVTGIGVWSARFTDWQQFCGFARGDTNIEPAQKLQPELIPARERRRAPEFVKMAVTVMDQACEMAGVDRSQVATVFASGMGDMQITDYMCRTLNSMPRAVSPTKFHNSVHNASTGYWSIATASMCPATAISSYDHSGAAAVLEAAMQVLSEDLPVLVAVQELAAPTPFRSVYSGDEPLAVAVLLTAPGYSRFPRCELSIDVSHDGQTRGDAANLPGEAFGGNFAAEMIPLLLAFAGDGTSTVTLPISRTAHLSVRCTVPAIADVTHG